MSGSTVSLTAEQANNIKLGMAAAQTAYALNNGGGIQIGQPLMFIDDAAMLSTSGAKPLNVAIPSGYIVEGIYKDLKTGLDAYMAFNRDTKEVIIGIGGTNGLFKDKPDTQADLISMGAEHIKQLMALPAFRDDFNRVATLDGSTASQISKVHIAGQSLGGGEAPLLGMAMVNGVRGNPFATALGIQPSQLSITSVNGFGTEYGMALMGYTASERDAFNASAPANNIVVVNAQTGTPDIVSTLGGTRGGNTYALYVEGANSIPDLHRFNFGVAEGLDRLGGDLTQMPAYQIEPMNHASLTRGAAAVSGLIPVANNAVSLSWAAFVSMQFSRPGESSTIISRVLNQYVGLSNDIAQPLGVLAESVLRILPATNLPRAAQLLAVWWGAGKAMGSSDALEPSFPEVAPGFTRQIIPPPGSPLYEQGWRIAVDTDTLTGARVLRYVDGSSQVFMPNGEMLISQSSGTAQFSPNNGGSLYLKEVGTRIELAPSDVIEPIAGGAWKVTSPLENGKVAVITYARERVQQPDDTFAIEIAKTTIIGQYEAGSDGKLRLRSDAYWVDRITKAANDVISDYDPYAPQGGIDRTGIGAYIEINGQRVLVRYEASATGDGFIASGIYSDSNGSLIPLSTQADLLRWVNSQQIAPNDLVELMQLAATVPSDGPASPREALAVEVAHKFDDASRQRASDINRIQSVSTTLQDVSAMVDAIKSGKPLPLLASGIRIVNDVHTLATGQALANFNVVNTVAGGALALYSLNNAFKGSGTDMQRVSSTLNSVNFVNQAFFKAAIETNGSVASSLNNALNGTGILKSGGVPGILPALGLITAIQNNDPLGMATSMGTLINPGFLSTGFGAFLVGVQLLKALTDEPPEAWGTARFKFTDGTQLGMDTAGESFGVSKVQLLMQGNGSDFPGLQGYLQQVIASQMQANPDVPLGIIAQRLPTLTWREARTGDPGYSLVDIDPLTGAQRYANLRYNDNFTPYNADAADPAQTRSLFDRMIASALQRQAIAPMWEVQTARLQQDAHDPNAGLTEEERAAKAGFGAQAAGTGHFRPVTLDLDGDGRVTTITSATAHISFNWDDSGYQKRVGWVGASDGFLFLDRNPNGMVDAGRELFSNGLVADAAKGVRSLSWVDANGDGVINSLDPVFNQLKVWQDANQDGVMVDVSSTGEVTYQDELKSMAELGITELDYRLNRFIRNGQIYSLQSQELDAAYEGSVATLVPDGIRVQFTDGQATVYVQDVSDLGGNGIGPFTAGDDGIRVQEDGGADDPAHPASGQSPSKHDSITLLVTQLLANDQFNSSTAGLTVTSVGNASIGTVTLDSDAGEVRFKAPDDFTGHASFDYTVTAPDGQTRTATVQIDVTPVNDLPTVSFTPGQRAVYGYGVLAHTEQVGNGDSSSTVVIIERDKGTPHYAPYATVGGQEMIWSDGESSSLSYGPMVDTGIPLSDYEYFAAQYNTGPDSGYDGTIEVDGKTYKVFTGATYWHDVPTASEISNDGTLTISDKDGNSGAGYKFELYTNPLYGRVDSLDANTGEFAYTGNRFVQTDALNRPVGSNVFTDDHILGEETHVDTFQVKVTDLSDPTGNTFTIQTIPVTHFGPLPLPDVQSGGKKPVAIDLNGDGFHFTDVDDSNVFFDVNGDGWRRRMAWLKPDDGLVAYDKNADGKIDSFDEISFVPYSLGAQTDLEGLRAFDTNHDGVLSSGDDAWASFGVWQDANSNGVSDAGEFKSMSAMGLSSISLTSDGQFQVIDGQTVHGAAVATKTDNSTLTIADVTLSYKNIAQNVASGDDVPATVPVAPFQSGDTFTGTADKDLVFGTDGSDAFDMGYGDDVVMDDGGNDMVRTGAGNDLVYSGAGDDFVDAAEGDDNVFTGAGNDVIFGGDGNDMLVAEGGNDVVFGGAGADFISLGKGNDVAAGGQGDDKVFGEGGWDALFGQEGDDELWGGDGEDLLEGGAGNDLLVGGTGADSMTGGEGDDTYDVDDTGDQVIEVAGGGIDTVRTSLNDYVLGSTVEKLTLTDETNAANPGSDTDSSQPRLALIAHGNALDNVIVGNSASNTLYGEAGNDVLDGGQGVDTMVGGEGDDTYYIDNVGDALVEDPDADAEALAVVNDVKASLHTRFDSRFAWAVPEIDGIVDATVTYLAAHQGQIIIWRDVGTALEGQGINTHGLFGDFQGMFSPLKTVDLSSINSHGGHDTAISRVSYALADNVENLVLTGPAAIDGAGNDLANTLTGNDAANVLDGAGGADTLRGGHGDDTLMGGEGDDTYVFARGDGSDRIVDMEGLSQISFGEGIAEADLRFTMRGTDMVIDVLRNGQLVGDRLTIEGWLDNMDGLRDLFLANGTTVWLDIPAQNNAPVASAIEAEVSEDSSLPVTGSVTATDPDGDAVAVTNAGTYQGQYGTLTLSADGTYSYALNNGLAAVQALNAQQSLTDTFAYVVVDDGSPSQSASSTIMVTIQGANDAPVVTVQPADASAKVLQPISIALPDGMFTDADQGDTLTIAAAWVDQNGQDVALPVWLSFDPAQRRFTGNAPADLVGQHLILRVIATDALGASASSVFQLNLESGALALVGTDGNDTLTGSPFDDSLDGGAGADAMTGGAGNDAYTVDNTGDQVIESANEGFDQATSSIDYVLPQHVEQLTLTGHAIRGTGNALDNLLFGNALANVLDGQGGADQMAGGQGDDRYWVDNTGDVVVEAPNEGIDTVYASVNRTLEVNVENLVLAGTAALSGTGNELANLLVGNIAANTLSAGAGNDVLAGGQGNDTLDGGQGDDLYLYNQGDNYDVINDVDGIDTLRFGAGMRPESVAVKSFSVNGQARTRITVLDAQGNETTSGVEFAAAGTNGSVIDRFEFVDANGHVTQSLTLSQLTASGRVYLGTSANDTFTGNSGADQLYGKDGNDHFAGLVGQDKLWVGNGDDWADGGDSDDVIGGGAGNDTMYGGNDCDVLIAGSGADIVYGESNNDFIDGGAGDDVLFGGGGSDFIAGGLGNDTLNGGAQRDIIAFNKGDGNDTFTSVDGAYDVLSLGGGVRYADLHLVKSGNNLVLNIGASDSVTFKDWYTNVNAESVLTLQMITAAQGGDYNGASNDRMVNRKVVTYNFVNLVSRFDALRAADPTLTSWAVAGEINNYYVTSSDNYAIGGNLTWRYATVGANGSGSYGDIDPSAIQQIIHGMNGDSLIAITNSSGTVDPWTAMQAGVGLSSDPSALPTAIDTAAPLTADQLALAALNASQAKPSWLQQQP